METDTNKPIMSSAWCSLVVVLFLGQTAVAAGGGGSEKALINDVLLKDYDPIVRPVKDSQQPIQINISLGLKSLVELNMKQQTLTSFGWLRIRWLDMFLMWNVSEYPVFSVHFPASRIWRPELVIFNTVTKLDELEDQKIRTIVQHDGAVQWYAGGLLKTFCSVDITLYPMDTQSCDVEVMSWSLNDSFVELRAHHTPFDVAQIDSHPEWTLIETRYDSITRTDGYSILRFTFILKRKIVFYVINMILPLVLLSQLNCLVFLLPVEYGEKMTASVTVFVSFAVFMTLINNSLPQNSDSVCLFNLYVVVQMFLSVCSIFMAASIVFVFKQNKDSADQTSEGEGQASGGKKHDLSSESGMLHDLSLHFLPNLSSAPDSATPSTITSLLTSSPSSSSSSSPSSASLGFDYSEAGSSTGQTKDDCGNGCLPKRKGGKKKTEKRELSSTYLDRIFFFLTIGLNLLSCIVFIGMMAHGGL